MRWQGMMAKCATCSLAPVPSGFPSFDKKVDVDVVQERKIERQKQKCLERQVCQARPKLGFDQLHVASNSSNVSSFDIISNHIISDVQVLPNTTRGIEQRFVCK